MSIQINAQGKLDILKDRTEERFHPTEDFTLEEIQSLLDQQREEIVEMAKMTATVSYDPRRQTSVQVVTITELEVIINKIKEM